MMDKKLKAKWVKALRSGEYKQANGALRDGSGFCCLGVLLNESERGAWDGEQYCINTGEESDLFLSGELEGYASSLGLTTEQEVLLIQMNDGEKDYEGNPQSFAQIADYIEKNL